LLSNIVKIGVSGSSVGQGINITDSRVLKRQTLVQRVLHLAEQAGALLIKSPPMSGKSSLLALVADFIHQSYSAAGMKSFVISTSTLNLKPRGVDLWDFDEGLKAECGYDLDFLMEIARNGHKVFLLIDEAQLLYNTSEGNNFRSFWELVKLLLNDSSQNLRIVLFAPYGSSPANLASKTPVDFLNNLLTIKDLVLDDEDVTLYVKNYFQYFGIIENWDAFLQKVYLLTGGHIGLLSKLVVTLHDNLQNASKRGLVTDKLIFTELIGSAVYNSLKHSRAASVMKHLNDEEAAICRKLLFGNTADIPVGSADSCIKKSILVQDRSSNLFFANTIIQKMFMELICGSFQRARVGPENLQEFLTNVLKNIDYQTLLETYGRSKRTSILLERSWQMEFFKCAQMCSPGDWIVSADVGSLFQSSGSIDFTVHSVFSDVFWGIELLREEDRLNDHVSRFQRGGLYSKMKKLMSAHCILDFTLEKSLDQIAEILMKGVYVCNYSRDFSSVTLYLENVKRIIVIR
jgi:hypothetical protein